MLACITAIAVATDKDEASYVKLSMSSRKQGGYETVSNAIVVITDDSGGIDSLIEGNNGEYWTNPTIFKGEVGKSYTLSVVTPDGEEYRSSPCLMYPVTEMDSIYYEYYEAIPEGYSDSYTGINIYASTLSESVSGYRRWTYDEWWKFQIPYPVKAQWVNEGLILDVEPRNEICWSHNPSININLHTDSQDDRTVLQQSVLFLPTQLSNRFQTRYYIEVNQLSLSREEYEFWNNMKLLNESSGAVFDKQPYSVVGNVKNLNHPSKNALGYFQVSSVSSKHIYITDSDIRDLNLYRYHYDCERFTATLDDLPAGGSQDFPWTTVHGWGISMGFVLIGYEENILGLSGLIFARPYCTNCTMNGVLEKPDFWIE